MVKLSLQLIMDSVIIKSCPELQGRSWVRFLSLSFFVVPRSRKLTAMPYPQTLQETDNLYDCLWASIIPDDKASTDISVLQLKIRTEPTVWIASHSYPYEGDVIIGAYTTKDRGIEALRAWKKERNCGDLAICEVEIDT